MTIHTDLETRIGVELDRASANLQELKSEAAVLANAAEILITALKGGGKVMFCGNGGSAADAQHLAAEFMGRYLKDRSPLPALALTVDTSALTAIANDYSFAEVFSRQVRGIGRRGDVLVGISTSGNSPNVLKAIMIARELGIATIALTGQSGGQLAASADLTIRAPSGRTNSIQEMHIVVGHLLCGFVEESLC